MQSHPKVPPSKAVTLLLHCVGKGDSQVGLCSLALLTQSIGTRYRIGPNTFNLPPAPGFTAQGFPPVSAQSSGYANCNLPASPHFSCWRWVLVPVTYPCLGSTQGQAPEDETSTYNSEQRGSGIPGADPASGKREAHGRNVPWKKKEWNAPFPSTGRGRLNKANKKGHQTNFILKPMNLD